MRQRLEEHVEDLRQPELEDLPGTEREKSFEKQDKKKQKERKDVEMKRRRSLIYVYTAKTPGF